MTTWCAAQISGGPNLFAFRTTDTAARDRARIECKREAEDFLQESTHEENGLVQDDELVARHRFVNEAKNQEQPWTQSEDRGRIQRVD